MGNIYDLFDKKNCNKLSGYTHFDRNETGY